MPSLDSSERTLQRAGRIVTNQPMEDSVVPHWTWSQAMHEARRVAAYADFCDTWSKTPNAVVWQQV